MDKQEALNIHKEEIISTALKHIGLLDIDINTPCNKIETVLLSSNGVFILGYNKKNKKYYVSYLIPETLLTRIGSVGWYEMDVKQEYIT